MAGILSCDNEVAALVRRLEGNSAQEEVVPFDDARRHSKPPRKRTVAEFLCISDAPVRARSRIRGTFILEVRSARSAGDVGPRARARIHALAVLEALEPLFIMRRLAPTEDRTPRPSQVWTLIPIETKPAEVFERSSGSPRPQPRPVQVFDAQNDPSACMPCGQPGDQKRARVAEVQSTRRRRGEPADDRFYPPSEGTMLRSLTACLRES